MHATDLPMQKTELNPNKALWEKGDFTRIAETMRARGEALVEKFGIKKGLGYSTWVAVTPRRSPRPNAALMCWAWISRPTWSPRNKRAKVSVSPTAGFSSDVATEGCADQTRPLKHFERCLPPSVHVRRDDIRVTRPGGDIVIADPQRSDVRSAGLKVLGLHAAAEEGSSADTGASKAPPLQEFRRQEYPFAPTFTFTSPHAGRLRRPVQELLRAGHECLRSRGEERAGGGSAGAARAPVQGAEQELTQGHNLHSRDVPARHGCALTLEDLDLGPERRETVAQALAASAYRLSICLPWGAVAIAYVVARALIG